LPGSFGVASKTVPDGSFKFRRAGFGSDFFGLPNLVFMVVTAIFHHHELFVNRKTLAAVFPAGE
jgi:hypothetical protein